MAKLVKRTEIIAWLNTTPGEGTVNWGLVGNGMTTGSYSYDVTETSETYIVDDSATTTIDSYSISIDGEMKCMFGDAVYDYINGLRYNLSIGSDAETQILLVDKYDVTSGTSYKAQKFNCTIGVSSYGGDGGATPTIAFNVHLNGTPVNGTVTIADGVPTFVEGA